MLYPKKLEKLIESFKLLPGVGEKTAERYAYSMKEKDYENVEELCNSLIDFKKNIKDCLICGCICDEEICEICSDKGRDISVICIVEDSRKLFTIERTGTFRGLYHVLSGLISPIEGINPDNINLNSLIHKRINKDVKEVIIALNPSIEGEVTSMYIQKLLENKKIKVSRLSYGIPLGTDIEYLDPIMISKALEDRKTIS